MSIQTKRLLNRSEATVSELLHRSFEGSEWRIAPRVPIRNVIAIRDEGLTAAELSLLSRGGEFDFAVYRDRRFDQPPAFVVEFDGPYHAEPEQMMRDIAKNRLCQRTNLPLLRLGDEDFDAA